MTWFVVLSILFCRRRCHHRVKFRCRFFFLFHFTFYFFSSLLLLTMTWFVCAVNPFVLFKLECRMLFWMLSVLILSRSRMNEKKKQHEFQSLWHKHLKSTGFSCLWLASVYLTVYKINQFAVLYIHICERSSSRPRATNTESRHKNRWILLRHPQMIHIHIR